MGLSTSISLLRGSVIGDHVFVWLEFGRGLRIRNIRSWFGRKNPGRKLWEFILFWGPGHCGSHSLYGAFHGAGFGIRLNAFRISIPDCIYVAGSRNGDTLRFAFIIPEFNQPSA